MAGENVTSTRPTGLTVGDPCAAYNGLLKTWQRNRAVLGGQSAARSFDVFPDATRNLLLPFSPMMAPAHYNFFKAEGELPGLVASYAKVVVGGLLRKSPQFTLPEGLPADTRDWLEKDFGGADIPMVSVLADALWEELNTGRCWIGVDFPAVSPAEWDAMSPAEQDAVKPYTVVYGADQIINWRTVGKKLVKLTMRFYEESWPVGQHHPDLVDTVYDYYLDNAGLLCIQKYVRDTNDTVVVSANGSAATTDGKPVPAKQWRMEGSAVTPTVRGRRLDRIPVLPLNGGVQASDTLLQSLIDREIGLYNKVSRRNHLLYGAATYTPYVASDMSDDQFQSIVNSGLGTWIHVGKGETVGAMETPTAALSDMEKAIAATVEEMARMGIRMLAPDGSAAQSGVSLEIRNAAQTAQLGLLNERVSQTLESVIELMLYWCYDQEISPGQLDFTLSQDFNPTPLGADWLKLVTDWYTSGLIPRSLWLNICQQNDIIPAEYDDKDGQGEIQTDPLVQKTPRAIDVNALLNGGQPNKLAESKQ
jgi:hypothetical protein